MSNARCNLVLVSWGDDGLAQADLAEIAGRVSNMDPSIRSFVVPHHKLAQLRLIPIWSRPTLSLSFLRLTKRKLLPGRVLGGMLLHKHGEYARLDAARIPVPRWTVIDSDTRLDPAEWGPYVVEKPSAGRRGAYVRIRKTSRLRYVAPDALPADHHGRNGPMIAQSFIYTGERPTSYRVVTLFGEVLLCYRQISELGGYPLKSRWNFRETGGINIASNTKEMSAELIDDEAVIAFAERAHREAFPDFPVLAFDIIRDCDTGSLYVLECHAGGTWMFVADVALAIQASNNIDFRKQFGAIEKAARIIARETPKRAAISWPFARDTYTRQ